MTVVCSVTNGPKHCDFYNCRYQYFVFVVESELKVCISVDDSLFSSHKLKAQESFSDYFLSGAVCRSVRLSVNFVFCFFLHFRHLFQNDFVNFNQTCHKSLFGESD